MQTNFAEFFPLSTLASFAVTIRLSEAKAIIRDLESISESRWDEFDKGDYKAIIGKLQRALEVFQGAEPVEYIGPTEFASLLESTRQNVTKSGKWALSLNTEATCFVPMH